MKIRLIIYIVMLVVFGGVLKSEEYGTKWEYLTWVLIDVRDEDCPPHYSYNLSDMVLLSSKKDTCSRYKYDLLIETDSTPNWFDTIVVVKHYSKHSDTIKVALEDL